MKSRFIIFFAIALMVSCSKDKFQSAPHLVFKDASNNVVGPGGGLNFTIEFTDKEGDLTGNVRVRKISSSCPAAGYTDSLKFQIPRFPASNNQKGDILLTMDYALDLNPVRCNAKDSVETAIFKFWIKDAAGNYSDTATSGPITILK